MNCDKEVTKNVCLKHLKVGQEISDGYLFK